MGFCTRNHDGASGKGEPVNTIPAKDQRGMEKVARQHDAKHLTELYSSPSLGGQAYDPKKAGRN
jgi:hypothetical protein